MIVATIALPSPIPCASSPALYMSGNVIEMPTSTTPIWKPLTASDGSTGTRELAPWLNSVPERAGGPREHDR